MTPSMPAGMKNGFWVGPGFGAIFVTVMIAAAVAGASGLRTSAGSAKKTALNTAAIDSMGDKVEAMNVEQVKQGKNVAGLMVSIEGFGDDLKEIKRAVRRRDQ